LTERTSSKFMGRKFGPTAGVTKASGSMAWLAAKASSGMQMATSTKDSGKTTKLMATEFISTQTGPSTLATGKTICSTATAKKHGLTAHLSKVFTLKDRNMATVRTCGLITHNFLEGGRTTKYVGMAFISGQMDASTKAHGVTTICMVVAPTSGQTDATTKASTSRIKSMAAAPTPGPMAANTPESGPMESSMGKALTRL